MDDHAAGSRLLALTARARRLPHPAAAVALAVLCDVAPLALLVAVLAADVLPQSLLPGALAQTALFGAVYGLYVVQVAAWVGLWERRPLVTLGLERGRSGQKLLRGAALGLAVYGTLLALLAALGMVVVRSDPSPGAAWAVGVAALVALAGWGVQGSAEELLYRGWLLPVVATRAGLRWGVAASSVVFALSHLLGSPPDALLLVNLVLFGVFFALWALREGGLWGLIGWHAVVNWVSENLVVVGEGAGVGPLTEGLLLGLDETGPDLLTGGSIGLEASVLTSLVLGAGIAALARWPRSEGPRAEAGHLPAATGVAAAPGGKEGAHGLP